MPPMNAEELQDYRDSISLLSAEELKGQLGDDPEQDALINAQLAGGKAVEVKNAPAVDGDEGSSGKPVTHHSMGTDDDADDGDDGDDDGDGDGEEDGDGEPEAQAAAAPAAEAAAAAEAVVEAPAAVTDEQAAAALPPPDMGYVNQVFDEKLVALDAAKAEQFKKMMGGEIEADEYAKFDAQYMRDRDALRDDKAEAVQWVGQVHKFQIEAFKSTGINYAADEEKAASLDQWVKVLAAKNPGADGNLMLQQAHKKVMIEFDIAPQVAAPAAAKPAALAAPAPVAKKGRAPDLSTIPPSLGALPAASNPGAGDGGEFAHLDRLDGMALERALASLTPDQQARYLAE